VRYSAGSEALAREFIRRVQPQVYREEVNFAAIKTALVSREKIDRRRRQRPKDPQAIDVKIDRGGIRDIEFLVQCLQRVYGGAEAWLRSGGTLFSLQKLHDKRHISGRDFHELTSAYTFLRHLEHRLQLRQGQQVHRLPSSACDRRMLERAMENFSPGNYKIDDLSALVGERMAAVSAIYQRVIYQQQAHRTLAMKEDEFQLQAKAEAAASDQSHQYLLAKLADDAAALYKIARAQNPGSAERKNVLRLLSSAYSSSERYASLLRHQDTVAALLPLFADSEYITDIIVRYPEEISALPEIQRKAQNSAGTKLFDITFEDEVVGRDPIFAYVATSQAGHSEKIALLRRHFRHCLLVSAVRDLAELRPVYASLGETTAAAENALAAAFGICGAPQGLAVLALGRLGSREFDLLSDADLLFVCDEKPDRGSLTRSAEQLIQSLAAYTQEGMVFPVDTRLRPRGAEGELLVSPVQLERYFATDAQPWEALTYTKLRFVCGDVAVARRAQSVAETLFRRFAHNHLFTGAVREMRQKLQDASAPEKSIRTSAGGLYDTDFVSSFLLVKYGIRPKTGSLRDRLWRCSGAGLLDKRDAAMLDHAAELCRTVEHDLRLVVGRNARWLPSGVHARTACEKLAANILRQDFPDGLEAELLSTFSRVREIYDRVLK
jgi:[glutamine synthetase] adenylyltransferase / [glutamine synthetase]-adenylyl-L-tyrosine phosphorylase